MGSCCPADMNNGTSWLLPQLNETAVEDLEADLTDTDEAIIPPAPVWLSSMVHVLRKYIITFLCTSGVAFNLLSIGALINKRIGFNKILTYLFILLNLSDSH